MTTKVDGTVTDVKPEDVGGEDTGDKKPPVIGDSKTDRQDVRELLEKVRKEEKSKLYPQIDHLKKMNDQLQREKELLMNQLSSAQEEEKKKGTEKMSEIQQVQKRMAELAEQNALLQTQLTTTQEETQKALSRARLDSYRSQRIAAAGGDVIPELVFGESEAEIDAALIASKQRLQEIRSQVRASLKQDKKETPIPSTGGTPPMDTSTRENAEVLTAEMLSEMSPDQWAKERLNIRRQVDSQMKTFFRGGPR
jgi:hypothetical protein